MKRCLVLVAVAAFMMTMAVPASAQYGPGPSPCSQGNVQGGGSRPNTPAGGQQPPGQSGNRPPQDDPPGRNCQPGFAPSQTGQVQTTTPCSTMVITGGDWSPSTLIQIERDFDASDCAGQGTPNGVSSNANGNGTQGTGGGGGTNPAAFASTQQVRVADDGTFSAQVVVPADVAGAYTVNVRGTDLNGQAKHQAYTYDVQPTANFAPVINTEAAETGSSTTSMAVAAVLVALLLAVGLNVGPRLARRRR